MENKDTRSGFGDGLTELGRKNKNVVAKWVSAKIKSDAINTIDEIWGILIINVK